VTHDTLGLTDRPPKFAPRLGDVASPMLAGFRKYVADVTSGTYPAPEHGYAMPPDQKRAFADRAFNQKASHVAKNDGERGNDVGDFAPQKVNP
jgi:hypothetical protein